MTDRRLLLVHAHPDDETIGSGATMARYAAEGAHVTLITCTLGELGEVLVPELEGLAAERADQLGGYRVSELAAAMAALGVDDHRFLGGVGTWRDSGMIGTPGNEDPRAFWSCDSDAANFASAVAQLVAVVREIRPQVLITYDEIGGYGHPDHIMAHRVAMAAVDAAAQPGGEGEPWQIEKVYWGAVPKSLLQAGIDALAASGQSLFEGVTTADDLPFGNSDDEITTVIDASAYAKQKNDALRAHATQISVDGPFFALSNNIGMEVLATEHYRLVRGDLGGERDDAGHEVDLFAGDVGMSAPRESANGALDFLVLALVCATAFVAGILEVMLVPLYSGTQLVPITVLLGMVTMFGLPRLGIWMTGTMSGAVLPVVSWFVPTLGLTLVNRPEGDVLVPGGNAQQWVLFALIFAGAIVGFTTVVRSSAALAPVQRRPRADTTVNR